MSHHKSIGKLKTITLTYEDIRDATGPGASVLQGYIQGVQMTRPGTVRDLRLRVPVVPRLDSKILCAVERETELKKLKMRKGEIRGTLDMGSWHGVYNQTCGTTHCRLGWAEFFGGAEAEKLRRKTYVGVVGALIYLASTGQVPDFSASLKPSTVLKDLRQRALAEKRRKKAFKFKHAPKTRSS